MERRSWTKRYERLSVPRRIAECWIFDALGMAASMGLCPFKRPRSPAASRRDGLLRGMRPGSRLPSRVPATGSVTGPSTGRVATSKTHRNRPLRRGWREDELPTLAVIRLRRRDQQGSTHIPPGVLLRQPMRSRKVDGLLTRFAILCARKTSTETPLWPHLKPRQ
jgi:hypothetical protein